MSYNSRMPGHPSPAHDRLSAVLCAVFALLIPLSCRNNVLTPDIAATGKALAVYRLAFDLENNQFVSPGETVRIFAKANRSNDVRYDWSVSGGTFVSIESNCISYSVPNEPGEYSVKVVVSDEKTGEKAEKELKIRVGSESALAVSSRYSYTIEQQTSFDMKISGKVSESRISRLTVNGDRTRMETETPEGTSVVEIDGDEMFVSDDAGVLRSVGSIRSLDGAVPAADLPGDCFALFCEKLGQPERSGNEYVFRKVENGFGLLLVLDARTGFPLNSSSRDEVTGEKVETVYTYQTVDGFVFPETVTQKVTIPIADETAESEFTVKVSDVVVDPDVELPDEFEQTTQEGA